MVTHRGHDIIAIGGSMGAMSALRTILPSLPRDLPAAILVVVHLEPRRPTTLDKLLGAVSALPVELAENMAKIERGRVYVAPPDHHLLVGDEHLRLTRGATENRHRPAVDPLFRTAAHVYGPRVVGVVLTGGLDCGAAGLAAIKRQGGVAIVQDPDEAECPDMPRSALLSTDVDAVLRLEDIAPRLVELVTSEPPAQRPPRGTEAQLPSRVPGQASGLACPVCAGSLWSDLTAQNPPFVCRVGHAFSPKGLGSAQSDAIDGLLWATLRALEESAELSHRMAQRSRELGDSTASTALEAKALEEERRAHVVRHGLLGITRKDETAEAP
jgi:two-component system chemotaxis response regulator CheB